MALLFLGVAHTMASWPCVDMGFFFSDDLDVRGHERIRALGPVFEHQAAPSGERFTAVRPFVSTVSDPDRDYGLVDVLWPLSSFKQFRDQSSWRVLLAYGLDYDRFASGSHARFGLFPLFLGGRDKAGELYAAVFPLGGSVHEVLMQDRIQFVLFPLYTHHVRDDVEGHQILFPFIGWSSGDNISKVRVFPFYGRSENRRIGQVNSFVLWPLWSRLRYTNGEPGDGGFLLFPFYGQNRKGPGASWTVLPPLFRYTSRPALRELHAPWPFIQWSEGDVDKLYLWPVWGRKRVAHVHSQFVLWPVVSWRRMDEPKRCRRQVAIVPVFFYESEYATQQGERVGPANERYCKVWPLASYRREGEVSRFAALDLWPLKRSGPVDRNFSTFWTFYTRARQGERKEDDLLWGLVKYRRDGDRSRYLSLFPLFSSGKSTDGDGAREWSLLWGALGYRREGLRKSYRLLYFFDFGDDE